MVIGTVESGAGIVDDSTGRALGHPPPAASSLAPFTRRWPKERRRLMALVVKNCADAPGLAAARERLRCLSNLTAGSRAGRRTT